MNEYNFPADSATAWQNLAQVRLEWQLVGGWVADLQGSLWDLYRAFMDVKPRGCRAADPQEGGRRHPQALRS
eukprot:10662661-Alexandrium_andersonii.AAC.1